VAPKVKSQYRIAVNNNQCTGCTNCIEYCPQQVLAKDTKLNSKGVHAPTVVAIEKCTGCKLCELFCGNFAIAVGVVAGAEKEGGV